MAATTIEKKLERVASGVDDFLNQAKRTQTSLEIIKMTGRVEEGRQLVQQLELDLKTRPATAQTAALKKSVAKYNQIFTRQERQLAEVKDELILRAGESSSGHIYDSSDSEEEAKFDDESTGFISGSRGNAKSYRQSKNGGPLTNAEKALKRGYAVSDLARNAMVNLRS